VIGGAITAIDKGVESQGKGGGISIPWISLGHRVQSLDSLLDTTIYFQKINGVVIPLTTQNVSMALRTTSRGGDLSGNVGSVGGFLAVDFARADGQMQAVRALIDLAMIQAVGSWAGVPYQRCLTLRQSDPAAIQTARRTFDKMKPTEQIRQIADALAARGLLVGDYPTDSVSQSLRQAIADFQMQQQLPALGLPTFEVYYALYADRYGAAAAPRNPIVAMGRSSNSLGLRVFPFGPNFVSDPNGTPFIVTGQRANFSVSAAQSVHVTCFYTDAGRRTTRIFPNPQHPDDRLLAYETLSLPGPSDIYTIEPDRVGGEEFVTCAASTNPITDAQLGSLGRRFEPGMQPLPVPDANALVQRLRSLGLDQLSIDRLRFVGACQSPRDGKLYLRC
jgi:peptidoglycan hydrolase-like protein with peptidoglycan-binding domain